MPNTTLDYAPRSEFDTGAFVARYLQVLAWLSIASMIVNPIFFDTLHIDLSPIFSFWAASALNRRSRTARKWVLAVTGLALGALILTLIWAVVVRGWYFALGISAVAVPMIAVVGIPFAVLMSERARRQFNDAAPPPVDSAELARRISEVTE